MIIASELELPELGTSVPAVKADVTIQRADLSDFCLDGWTRLDPLTLLKDLQYHRVVPGVLTMLARDGSTLCVDIDPACDAETVRVFLLGMGFGALLFQRGLLVLHGNAVRIGDACLICAGPSGAGKSTLSAGFLQRGFSVVADDVVAVDALGRTLPGFPRIKLWQDAVEQLSLGGEGVRRLRPDLSKFNIPIAGPAPGDRLPVRWVCILEHERTDKVTLTRISGMDRLSPLMDNTYSLRLAQSPAQKITQLGQLSHLSAQAEVLTIRRPAEGFSVDAMVTEILSAIGHS